MSTYLAPHKRWVLFALMLTMMLAAMDITIVSTVVPQMVEDLGGFSKFTWVFSIYLLAQTITIPIYGKLSDLYGRKKILVFGVLVFLLGSLACAMSWNMNTLILFRAIQGLGAGSIMATVNTIAGDLFSVKERAKIQGYLSSVWGISAILGPTLGGVLTEWMNWRWIFLINIPLGGLALFFLIRFFKEKVEVKNVKIDYWGAVLIVGTLSALLIFLLESGQRWPWLSWQTFLLCMLILCLGYLTYQVESKRDDAILPIWIWKDKSLALTNLSMIGMGILVMGPEAFLPTYIQTSLGLGIISSGLILACMSIGWPLASSLSGQIYLKIGFRNTALLGASIITLACGSFLWMPIPSPIYLLMILQIVIGMGFGFLSTPSLVGAQSRVGWGQRGVVTSSIIFSRNLGQSVGATLLGVIFHGTISHQIKKTDELSEAKDSQELLSILKQPSISEMLESQIQYIFHQGMYNLYIALIIFGLFTLLCIYLIPEIRKPDLGD